MLKKINNEIEEFTSNIKEEKECHELLTYMNSNISSSIKLLMSVSKTFSLYARVMLFFVISLTGLTFMSSISTGVLNNSLLSITIVLFFLTLLFIMHYKKSLTSSINKSKSSIEKDAQ